MSVIPVFRKKQRQRVYKFSSGLYSEILSRKKGREGEGREGKGREVKGSKEEGREGKGREAEFIPEERNKATKHIAYFLKVRGTL